MTSPHITIKPNKDIRLAEKEGQMIMDDLRVAFKAAVRTVEQAYDVKIGLVGLQL